MHLSALHVYPIKSGAALSPREAEVQSRGLAHDRRWMIVDADGRFLTGRQLPKLATLRAEPTENGLHLQRADRAGLHVDRPAPSAARRRVSVWKDTLEAPDAGDAAAQWLSDWLQREVRLVHMDADALRPLSPACAQPGDEVSFAWRFRRRHSTGSMFACRCRCRCCDFAPIS